MEQKPAFEIIDRRSSQRTDEDRANEAAQVEEIRKRQLAQKRVETAQQKERMRQATESMGSAPYAIDASKEGKYWKEVAYTHILANVNGNTLAVGRCVGERSDGAIAYADYVFGPRVEEDFDWKREARKRLETYLRCPCSPATGECPDHRGDPWMNEGLHRIQKESDMAMPAVLEKYYREAIARQNSKIIRPR